MLYNDDVRFNFSQACERTSANVVPGEALILVVRPAPAFKFKIVVLHLNKQNKININLFQDK